jgi:hypothetical protein
MKQWVVGWAHSPFQMLQQAVEACDKKQTRKTWGLADIVGFSSIVTLHAGLGFIFSHLNPATKFSLQLLLAHNLQTTIYT